MTFRKLGSTGLLTGPVVLGTVNFSWLTPEPESRTILDAAFDRGVNLIDTSDNYNAGETEALIGRWFEQGGGRRERTILATKVHSPPTEWESPDPARRTGSWVGPNQRGLSAKHIREACEASLRRLKTDHIDLYQMHHIDRATRWEEIWQAMEVLIAQGKILYVGSSNFAAWNIAQAQESARARQLLGLASEQSVYNLLKRSVELEVLPCCAAYDMAFLPYSPVAGGQLAGKPDGSAPGRRTFPENDERFEAFEAHCRAIGRMPADVALAWVAGQPHVTAPIIGPRTLAQFEGNLASIEAGLSSDSMEELDRIFPGPGHAPEAYFRR